MFVVSLVVATFLVEAAVLAEEILVVEDEAITLGAVVWLMLGCGPKKSS